MIVLSRIVGWALAVAWIGVPASAQVWNFAYYLGDPDNEIASVSRADDGGYLAAGHFEGAGTIFKVNATGSVAWARSYGPVRPVAVRPVPSGDIAWIGNVPDPKQPAALFVLTDFAGAVRRALRFSVPNTLRAEVTALEFDPADSTLKVGGNAWITDTLQEPWVARLDGSTGTVISLFALRPALPPLDTPQSARIEALVPTGDLGLIAVGRWVRDELWTGRNKMFAFRVSRGGGVAWSRAYVERVTLSRNEQWFVDVARDPRSVASVVYAVGHADQVCGIDRAALPCRDLFTGADLVAIDAATGDEKFSTFFEAAKHAVVFNPTAIARDDGTDQIAIAGSLDDGTTGFREAVLLRVRPVTTPFPFATVLGTESYGDGTGPFVSEVADLALRRRPSSPVSEPGFVLANRQSKPGMDRPTLVATDTGGLSDGKCEQARDLFSAPSGILHVDIPLVPADAVSETYDLHPSDESLTSASCSLISAAATPQKPRKPHGKATHSSKHPPQK
jgi:hypothetical protein